MHAAHEGKNGAHGVTRPTLSAILQLRCAGCACTVDAAEDLSVCFDTVADDSAVAVRANRRQRVDCAFEAIEGVTLSAHNDFKRLVVFVFANFAYWHTQSVRAGEASRRCLIHWRRKFCERSSRHHRCRLQPRRSICGAEIFLVFSRSESYHCRHHCG